MNNEVSPAYSPEGTPSIADTWTDALVRMSEVVDEDEMSTVMDVSLKDADTIAAWREEHTAALTPQSVFFLTISEAAKRHI